MGAARPRRTTPPGPFRPHDDLRPGGRPDGGVRRPARPARRYLGAHLGSDGRRSGAAGNAGRVRNHPGGAESFPRSRGVRHEPWSRGAEALGGSLRPAGPPGVAGGGRSPRRVAHGLGRASRRDAAADRGLLRPAGRCSDVERTEVHTPALTPAPHARRTPAAGPRAMLRAPMRLGQDVLANLDAATAREWLLTNALGGAASGTAAGAHTRRSHAWLLAADADGRAALPLLKLEERLTVNGESLELGTNLVAAPASEVAHPPLARPAGHLLLEAFTFEPWPTWRWRAGGVTLERSLFLLHT